jgi:hypothetical protein
VQWPPVNKCTPQRIKHAEAAVLQLYSTCMLLLQMLIAVCSFEAAIFTRVFCFLFFEPHINFTLAKSEY